MLMLSECSVKQRDLSECLYQPNMLVLYECMPALAFIPVSDIIPAYESPKPHSYQTSYPSSSSRNESGWGSELEDYDEIQSSLARCGMSWIATRRVQQEQQMRWRLSIIVSTP